MAGRVLRCLRGSLPPLSRSVWSRPPFQTPSNFKVVMPSYVSPQVAPSQFPRAVPLPSYAHTMIPPQMDDNTPIDIKTPEEISKMRKSCSLAKRILLEAGEMLRVGITTDEIDQLVFDMCMAHNAYPSPLNYRGYPKSVCTSVNNVVCHGIPDDRPLANGDIINVDITVFLDGFHGDCSKTFLVGDVDEEGQQLVKATEECLQVGLEACGPGKPFCEVGNRINEHAFSHGFSIVGAFAGHGIGSYFHGPPDIYHVPNNYPGEMKPGMTFTVEPIVSEGSDRIVILQDGWTAVTCDHTRAAQFEHTVLITETGIDILTQ